MSDLDLTNPEIFQQELEKAAQMEETQEQAQESEAAETVEQETTEEVQEETAEEQTSEETEGESAEGDEEPEVQVTEKGKMVPYGALKAKTQAAQEANERAIQAETQLSMIMQALQAKQERESAPVKQEATNLKNDYDPDIQPVEYLRREIEIRDAKMATFERELQGIKTGTAKQTQIQQVVSVVAQDLQKAVATGEDPHAKEAYDYLHHAKSREFSMIASNEAELGQMLDNYFMSFANTAIQGKKSPAKMYRQLADSLGYKPAGKQTTTAPKRDVAAIERNKGKSTSLNAGTASAELNGAPKDIKFAMNKNGKGTNEVLFQKLLQSISQ